jgi:hypothetical protein
MAVLVEGRAVERDLPRPSQWTSRRPTMGRCSDQAPMSLGRLHADVRCLRSSRTSVQQLPSLEASNDLVSLGAPSSSGAFSSRHLRCCLVNLINS